MRSIIPVKIDLSNKLAHIPRFTLTVSMTAIAKNPPENRKNSWSFSTLPTTLSPFEGRMKP